MTMTMATPISPPAPTKPRRLPKPASERKKNKTVRRLCFEVCA